VSAPWPRRPRRHGVPVLAVVLDGGSLPSGCVLPWQDRDVLALARMSRVMDCASVCLCRGCCCRERCRAGFHGRRQQLVIEVAPGPGFSGFDGPDDSVTGALMMGSRVPVPRVVAAADVTACHAYPEAEPYHADAQAVFAAWGARIDGLDGVEMGAEAGLAGFEPDQHRGADTRRHRCSFTH